MNRLEKSARIKAEVIATINQAGMALTAAEIFEKVGEGMTPHSFDQRLWKMRDSGLLVSWKDGRVLRYGIGTEKPAKKEPQGIVHSPIQILVKGMTLTVTEAKELYQSLNTIFGEKR